MIFNSVTSELFDGAKGIQVVPCHYKLEYIEWKERGEGSGAPVAIHSSSSDIMTKTTRDSSFKDRLPNGNYIEKTASHFIIVSISICMLRYILLQISKNNAPSSVNRYGLERDYMY